MIAMSYETQLKVYTSLRHLEARSSVVDNLIGSLKRCCVHGGSTALTDLVAMTSELKWQMRKVNELTADLQNNLGMRCGEAAQCRETEPPGESSGRSSQEELAGIRGTTEVLSLPDLIGVLSSQHKTGTLALRDGESVAMFVFEFQEGRIVHAVTNQEAPGVRLGTILVAQNKLTAAQLQASLEQSLSANEMLGTHLVRTASVSESDLRAALDCQVRKIFDMAFGLKRAHFSFVEGNLSNIAQRTTINTTELLLDAARHLDTARHERGQTDADAETSLALDSVLGG